MVRFAIETQLILDAVRKRLEGAPVVQGEAAVNLIVHEGQGVRSISYDATRDVVFAVTELQLPPSVAGTTGARELFLHAIDASKLVTDPSKAWLWAYEIPQICLQFLGGAGVATTPYLGVSTDGSVVYFACRGFPDPSTFVLNWAGRGHGGWLSFMGGV